MSALTIAMLWSPAESQEQTRECCAHFDFLYERTLFNIDVVRLRLSVDEETGTLVRELLAQDLERRQLEDSAADLYLDTRYADVEMTFLRSISADRFLNGQEDTLEKLVEANYLDADVAAMLADENEERFAFLDEDGIQEGDRLLYALRGDTVRARYIARQGAERLSDVRIGPERRIALLGSYFGPDTNFRDGLLDSILDMRNER